MTIVVKDRKCVFGDVMKSRMVHSYLGKKVDLFWNAIPDHHKGVDLDEYVIMPNHLHGIIIIHGNRDVFRRDVPLNVSRFSAISPKKGSLSVIVRTFKGAVRRWALSNGHPEFEWQERFYDHIIRNDRDLHRIRIYIANNPMKWALDRENPFGGRP